MPRAAVAFTFAFAAVSLAAATAMPTPPAPPDDALPKLVAALSAQPGLAAADCARFARETITHGQTALQSGQPPKPGILHDGLAAVAQGEALDDQAADWPDLRRQLEQLLEPPPPQQDQQNQDEQKKDEEKENEQQQQQNQQDQQQQDPQNQDDKTGDQQQQQQQEKKKPEQEQQQSEDQKSEQQKQQEQQEKKQSETEQQQAKADESKKDTQKIGGEPAADDERREHPELAIPLQKLDEVRDQDSPAELFQLLQNDEPRDPGQPRKDW